MKTALDSLKSVDKVFLPKRDKSVSISGTLLISIVFLLTLASCDPNRVYEKFQEIPGEVWNRFQTLHFDVDIVDTVNTHNVFIDVRNTGKYQYANLFLFVTVTSPRGLTVRDTVELILSDPKGTWLGSGVGDIHEIQRPYKMNIRFPVKGRYTFEFEQAMRVNDLAHVRDIGLRVEKVTNRE